MEAPRTLDDYRELVRNLPGPDADAREAARAREANLVKPPGSLGRLESLAQWLSTWQGRALPSTERCRVVIFAGSHGITEEGVSAYPASVTSQMVANFEAGGAAINQLCALGGYELIVHALSIEAPTGNFLQTPAMDDAQCAEAMAIGASRVDEDIDIVCLGEMGIGNTTAAAAICHALYGGQAEDWTGPGTGVSGSALKNKIDVVRQSVQLHGPSLQDGLDILRHLGGRELAAIAGAILAARPLRVPVILDGFVSCAAAATLCSMQPGALDHCIVGHVSAEPGHRRLLDVIGKTPLLDFGMRLGEGSGATLALGLVRAAVAGHGGMATFAEAGVSDKAD